MKLESILRAGVLGLALAASSVATKAQIAVNTIQAGNTFNYQIQNNYTGGSEASLSAFSISVYGYQLGSAEFTSNGSGWDLTGSTAISYNTANDGYSLTFSSDMNSSNLQPNGGSMTLSLLASGPSLALTSQTAGFLTQGIGTYNTSIQSPGFVSVVPEPATYGAWMAGAAAVFAAWRRRKQMREEISTTTNSDKTNPVPKYNPAPVKTPFDHY